jgi:putative hydrolase of the HAD superfamily
MKFINGNQFSSLPHAVLFDTDNTLYPYDLAHNAAQHAMRSKAVHTLTISPYQFDEAFQIARSQIKKDLQQTAASHSRLLYIQRVLELLGLGSQILLALDLEQTYWRTFLSKAELFDGVKELLDDFRLLGIPTAIVTDLTAQIQFRKIIYFGLEHYFDFIVTSEEAGFDKPHSAPFQLALQKMKPEGNNIWMIGDNAETDILGAKRSIQAVTIQKIHHGVKIGEDDARPDATFSQFSEVRKLIKNLSTKKI